VNDKTLGQICYETRYYGGSAHTAMAWRDMSAMSKAFWERAAHAVIREYEMRKGDNPTERNIPAATQREVPIAEEWLSDEDVHVCQSPSNPPPAQEVTRTDAPFDPSVSPSPH
jgi:hypothetical protein